MREVLDHLGYTEEDYEQFLLQVCNIQQQSHRMSYWLRLPEDKTVVQIAADIGCPATDYSAYLRTFREWGGSAAACVCRDRCNCGKYAATLWTKRARMTAGSHVPDPFLDPKSGLLGIKPAQYGSPYGRVHIPVEAPERTEVGEVSTHPMAVLFPGTTVGQFARYLGGPIGMDSGAVEAFVRRRLNHATSIHSHLHQLN